MARARDTASARLDLLRRIYSSPNPGEVMSETGHFSPVDEWTTAELRDIVKVIRQGGTNGFGEYSPDLIHATAELEYRRRYHHSSSEKEFRALLDRNVRRE